MYEDDEKPLRYHLPEKFVRDPDEPVFLEKFEAGRLDWIRKCEAPEGKKTPEALQALLRETADTQGGEAWRAVTGRGELLRLFSVNDLAKELSGKKTITVHPSGQYFLCVARARLGV
jgi:hypothetical protein